jgi:hypothetical protein
MTPDDSLERLRELHRRARRRAGRRGVELYHRAATTLRVTRARGAATDEVQTGHEDGLAVRTFDPSNGCVGFAATSGCREGAVDWVVGRATESELAEAGCPWAEGHGTMIDRDPAVSDWDEARVGRWIDDALSRLPGDDAPRSVSVEIARTVETWVADGGPAGSRVRTRAWAVAQGLPQGVSTSSPAPLITAARSPQNLDVRAWSALVAERTWSSGIRATSFNGKSAVVFRQESAATLVQVLVQALSTPDQPLIIPVGPGWKLVEDPLEPGALLGGTFDDCGFPAVSKTLADGCRTSDTLSGPGSWRRGSYRDRPRPMAANVRVASLEATLPRDSVAATTVVLHRLDPARWAIEFTGGLLSGGEAGPSISRGFIEIGPEALVRRCAGTIGVARADHRGVTCPGLVFSDLPVRYDS